MKDIRFPAGPKKAGDMPRAVTSVLIVGGVALAAALTMGRGGPDPSPPVTSERNAVGLPANIIGTSALSHGDPAPVRNSARPKPEPCPVTTMRGAAVERSDGSSSTPCASDRDRPSRAMRDADASARPSRERPN
jgi:hypothetical protein